MTLGTLNAVRGLTYLVTDGAPVSGLQPEVRYMGQAYFDLGIFPPPAGIPASLILVAVCAIGLWFFLEKTNTGRHIYAIGGNPHIHLTAMRRIPVLDWRRTAPFAGMTQQVLSTIAGRRYSSVPFCDTSILVNHIILLYYPGPEVDLRPQQIRRVRVEVGLRPRPSRRRPPQSIA